MEPKVKPCPSSERRNERRLVLFERPAKLAVALCGDGRRLQSARWLGARLEAQAEQLLHEAGPARRVGRRLLHLARVESEYTR